MKKTFACLGLLALIICVLCLAVFTCPKAEATEWSKWQGYKQATFYTDMGGTASGRYIHPNSKYVAVDMSRVVSKKRWKKGSAKFKRTHFYYGEKLELKRMNGKYKGKTRKVTVADCGSFGGAGQSYKAKWVPRWFDLTDGARRGFISWNEGVGIVKWRYLK